MIFSRGLGDEVDEVGVVFRWRAPEGSEVRAFQQLPSYSNFAHVTDAADAQKRIEAITAQFGAALEQAGVHDVLLCAGDDHVRVRRDLPELCAELERRLPGAEVRIARYGEYVDAVDPDDLPVWTGELLGSRLWNILRGVNSARLYVKRANERGGAAAARGRDAECPAHLEHRRALPDRGLSPGLAPAAALPSARLDLRLLVRRGSPRHARPLRAARPDGRGARAQRARRTS